MRKPMLIGYVGTGDLEIVTDQDARALDAINIAFGHVRDGLCVWESGGADREMTRLRALNPDLKFILSVGGWGSGGFSEAAATAQGRAKFAVSARELLERHDLDGIDIDWEYPCFSMAEIEASPDDKENFTLYLAAIRDELDKVPGRHRILSIAAGGDAYFCRNTEMDKVSEILDYVQIMTYDLRGGYTHATGHHTNLFTPRFDFYDVSVEVAVEAFGNAGVPKEKMIIGAAFYSRWWQGVPDADNGYAQYAKTVGQYGPTYDEIVENYLGQGDWVRHWDDSAKAPWLFNGEEFISYDDPESIRHKVDYLKGEGLLGIMYWEYGLGYKHSLTAVLREELDRG